MNHDQTVNALRDFFCGYRHFKGMLTPQDSRVFAAFFSRLSPTDQQLMAQTIVAGALGQEPRLRRRCGSCIRLLLALCIAGYTTSFQFARLEFEQIFNNSTNVDRWLMAQDQPFVSDHWFQQTHDWHYPLILWNILFRLQSDQIETTYTMLHDCAASREFRRALHDVKDHLEHGTGWLGPRS